MAFQLVAIDDFLIDCILSESHTFESDVTEYPVESGSNITDNIRPKPIEIEMECIVTNTPIHIDAIRARNIVRGDDSTSSSLPSTDAYELLTTIREQRKPVTIRTSLRTYENMAMRNLTIPRGPALDELRFTATFVQIQTVENKRTIRTATPAGNGKKTVSKPPEVSDTRQILIDPVYRAWFDPDVGLWRKTARGITITMIDEENTVSIARDDFKWDLWRGKTFPVEHKSSSSWVYPNGSLVLTTLNQCKLHDFTIQKTFGGIVQPFNQGQPTVLKGRRF